ncbi:HNH endonuclease [Arcanobacterium phocisimile]|uniref:HNH endonuclease n=1 Tax=Arcanobacterium phocisimile TaxID=1302235 RepID=A0ABX7IF09_9ACTO|nr:HNH endonuclease family protein [Arcanobacterium phocisimile]QRV01546.1 HNH endonuclease [Arcanobacterium phocisimile]
MNRTLVKRTAQVVFCAIIGWLVVPGIGPDVFTLEESLGWKVGPDDWRGPLSRVPSYQINDAELAALLDTIPTRTTTNAPKYQRSDFGPAWSDVDHNGCDTRNDILTRDLQHLTYKNGTHNCVVTHGDFIEPYTGLHTEFQRGRETSALVQIDHVVALADAWQSGAWTWTAAKREQFANDPLNLLAVDADQNQEKGAAHAGQWLPENRSFHCAYVTRQVDVKAKWGLSMTQRERATIERILSACSKQ